MSRMRTEIRWCVQSRVFSCKGNWTLWTTTTTTATTGSSHHIFTAVTSDLVMGATALRGEYGEGKESSSEQWRVSRGLEHWPDQTSHYFHWNCFTLCDLYWDQETWTPPPVPPGKVPLRTVKKFSPDPNERFLSVAESQAGTDKPISPGNYNSALFPGFQ